MGSEDPPIRLVVGLGNPGARYARTRHNVGQRVVERLAERLGVTRFASKYAGSFADTRGPAGPVSLLVPTTYMNLSGDSVGPAAGALRLARPQVIVVHDELDLPFGAVRGKLGGGPGGHNGLRSIIRGLGGNDFARVRLGVGRPPADFRGSQADWVLARFAEADADVETMIDQGVAMTELSLAEGIEAAIARFPAAEPGSRASRRRERRDEGTEGDASGDADAAEGPGTAAE